MEFTEVVKGRYSCKKYSDRPLEKEKLDAILEAGRVAPTAKNLQEQKVYVVQSAEMLAKIDGVTPCRYGAPTVLIVAFDKTIKENSHQKMSLYYLKSDNNYDYTTIYFNDITDINSYYNLEKI